MAIFETVLKSDLKKPVQVKQLSGNLFSGDNQGNKITVEVMDNGSPATLSGGVTGYVIRDDNSTVIISSGTLSGNKASIVLPEEAYNVVGRVSIVVKVGTTTVGACTAFVYRTSTDTLVDPTGAIPSLQELLAKISACEQATADANKVANLTVSAEAATGSTPAAVLSETGSPAHKHITFKLVKGDKGDKGDMGDTPQFSIGTVTTLQPSQDATVTITGTDEEPVLNFGIPQGESGNETIDDTAGIGDTDLVWSADKSATVIGDLKSAFTESIKSTAENVISVSDFTETSGSPTKPTISVDTVNNELTITQASNGTYCAGQTVDTFVANNLINGRTYRLHAKATFLSGTPTVYLAVRGISGNVNAVAAYVKIKGGQDNFVEFIADQYMKRISLFVTWETAKTASVKFGDIWLEEYNTAGIDYKARDYIEKTNVALQYPWERNVWYERSDGSAVTGLTSDLYVSTPVSDYIDFQFGSCVTVKSGYRFNAYRYTKDSDHTFVDATAWISDSGYYQAYPEYSYKFVLAKANNTKISNINEASNLILAQTKDYFLHRSIVEKYDPEINDTVSRALSDKDANTITFCLMADSHNRSDISTVEHCNIISAMADRTASVFLAHLGDIIEGYGASKQINKSYLIPMWENLHKSNRPALYAIAHHELYGSGRYQQYLNDPTAITPSEAIGIWGKDTRWLGAVFSENQQNYYFDNSGIRFIFINGCSTSSTIGFSDDVISFVQAVLENCTLPVIVFSHTTANKYTNISDAEPTNAQALETILNDYGNVIAYFHGHVHWDNIAVPNGISYPYYSVCSSLPIKTTATCTLNENLHAWDREIGTITEFCIDIVNIHKDTGVIKTFRFGAGVDRTYVPT